MGGPSRGKEFGNAVPAPLCRTGQRGSEAGDNPFGSVLVAADGEVLFEDRNRVGLVIELGIPSSRLRGGRRRT